MNILLEIWRLSKIESIFQFLFVCVCGGGVEMYSDRTDNCP